MCNAYTVRPKVGAQDLHGVVSAAIAKLRAPLVRRSDPGVVLLQAGDEFTTSVMRWGFSTPKYSSVNNARSENLKRGMWAEAFENRRCLVPMSSFYEWQELPNRGKQPFEFQRRDGDWLWIAGLHGESDQYGPCFATITTEPTPEVAAIHDRLLAVVEFEEGMAFLRGEKTSFIPYSGPLAMTPCASPLKKAKLGPEDRQGELF